MKSILLASASIVAFAGAAAAEVSFGGDAKLGYNDGAFTNLAGETVDFENDGFYWDADLAVTLSQALNNGLTAKATFEFGIVDGTVGQETLSKNYLLELASENSSLQFGDVEFAAISVWNTAGAQLSADDFSEVDGETVLRGNVNYNGVDARISYLVADEADREAGADDLEQLSLGAKAAFGNFNLALAYQAESEYAVGNDLEPEEVFGLTVGTTFGGANVVLSYANATEFGEGETLVAGRDSIGLSVGYPVGPVSLRGWVASNSDHEDLSYGVRAIYTADAFSVTANFESRGHNEAGTDRYGQSSLTRWNLEGSYNVGNGLTAYAGVVNRENWEGEAFYVGGEMDLGNGAALLLSFADAEESVDALATNPYGYLADDEVGARAYQNGLTAEVKFTF